MGSTNEWASGARPTREAFEALCARIASAIGADGVSLDDEIRERHAQDWSRIRLAPPRAVVRPRSTADVAAVLTLCSEAGQPLVPQGGRTGLAGGASPDAGEIALSLERMNAIEAIDRAAGTITVGAGATLQAVQEAAAAEGLFYAVDLGARGSAAIGGTISTNAGGIRVLRYGMTREQVLGLEVVLADGTVLTDMSGIVKNNAGFDLKQLFVGSEGTLGVVTRAVLRLHPMPAGRATAWVVLSGEDALIETLALARAQLGLSLGAFEAMWPDYLDTVSRLMPRFRLPLPAGQGPALIVELLGEDADAERTRLETFLAGLIDAGLAADAVIAGSLDQERRIWAVRDEVPGEYPAVFAGLAAFDVSIPADRMVAAVRRLRGELVDALPQAELLVYGHLGDSNLHLVAGFPAPLEADLKRRTETIVYAVVREAGGSVSAEHGIGRSKRPWLGHTRTPGQVETMRRLKAALDPGNILNPGRVLPDAG